MDTINFLEITKDKMDTYVHFIYKITKTFPKEELYGARSQLRRSALSVILNFIEGYARKKQGVKLNFWEISYGSLKESKYLVSFAFTEKWITEQECQWGLKLAEELGAMLWKAMKPLQS